MSTRKAPQAVTPAPIVPDPLGIVSGRHAGERLVSFGLGRSRSFLTVSKAPTWWAFALTVIDSALTVLNQTTLPSAIGYGTAVKTIVTLILSVIAFLGIGPVLGAQFKTFIHLPAKIAGGISLALFVAQFAIQQEVSLPYSAIALGLIQFAGGLGFAPAFISTA